MASTGEAYGVAAQRRCSGFGNRATGGGPRMAVSARICGPLRRWGWPSGHPHFVFRRLFDDPYSVRSGGSLRVTSSVTLPPLFTFAHAWNTSAGSLSVHSSPHTSIVAPGIAPIGTVGSLPL